MSVGLHSAEFPFFLVGSSHRELVLVGHDVTTAEMAADAKDAISHRGEALRAIAPIVAAALA